MELVNLSIEKLDALKPVIDLEYIENSGDIAAKYFPVQVVYINRQTMHLMNPHTYSAMKLGQPENNIFPCLLVDIAADDEIGASIALNGGIDGLLAARPATDEANKILIQYIEKTFATQREKLFGLGPDASYFLDLIDFLNNPDDTDPEPDPEPDTIPLKIADIVPDFPTLDISKQATLQDVTGLQWVAYGSQSRATAAEGYHFYTDDSRFAAINDIDCKVAIEPNYSANELTPAPIAIGDIWNKRAYNKSFQQKGIKTIIDLNLPFNLLNYALLGVPVGWRAYANKYYKGDTDHLIKAYHLAKNHAQTENILYVVFGSEGAKDICNEHGWQWVNVAWRGNNDT